MAGSSLGIYFGPKVISIIEASGKKIINSIQIQRSVLSSGDLEEKVPDEVKIVALFKEELRKNNISAKEAFVSLSGKDMIIRTFETPQLPANELPNVVNFEVKKYIPFKIEELVSDFQTEYDRASRRNQVLYVGIKKEVLDKYLSIVSQLDIKLSFLEYSAFGLLRFLKLSNFSSKGVVALLNVDYVEEDEVNFSILGGGLPLFSRDIILSGGPDELSKPEGVSPAALIDKLKTEIRISMDYYHRKFLTKKVHKVFLVVNNEMRTDLESFFKEMALEPIFVDASKALGRQGQYSLGLSKAYGSSLVKVIKSDLKINLLASRSKTKIQKEAGAELELGALISRIRVDARFVAFGMLLCFLAFGYGMYQKLPIQAQLSEVIKERPVVPGIKPEASLPELNRLSDEYKKKVEALKNIITKQQYFTEVLDVIPRIIPAEVRLTNIMFNNKGQKPELILQGIAYTGNGDEELKLVNGIIILMKNNPVLKRNFKDIAINNIDYRLFEGITMTSFTISCKN
ncbi:MAG: hypothetical protein FJZ15_00315 [Candidatus Omnitrophica bacterium]|nr:hypothetical protein [Candidatus Omnitrophota bacterium]